MSDTDHTTQRECFDVFVSYAHADSLIVGRIVRRLHEYGIDCFLDNWRLRAGDDLDQALPDAVSASSSALVFISRTSLSSRWCHSEIDWIAAQAQSKRDFRIMPVSIDKSEIPDRVAHRIAISLPDHSDRSVIRAADEIAQAIGKLNPGIFGRTSVLTDRVVGRIDRVVEALDLHRSHPTLSAIASLLRRSETSVRDAGPCPCGGVVLCGFVDLGLVDWYSNFFHVCPECMRHEHEEVYSGATQENGSERMCPWCRPLWMW